MRARSGNGANASTGADHRARRCRVVLASALVAAPVASGCGNANKPAATASAEQPGSAGATAETARASDPECAFERDEVAGIDPLCAAIAAGLESGATCEREQSRLETAIGDEIAIEDQALTSAALFSLYVPDEHSDRVYIALRYQRAWHVSPLVTIYNPGEDGAGTDAVADAGASALPIESKSGVSVRFEPERGRVVIEAIADLDPSHPPGVYSLQSFPARCLPYFDL